MSTIINGAVVADPIVPTTKKPFMAKNSLRTLAGNLLTDNISSGIRWEWDVEWKNLTQSEYDTLISQLLALGTVSFSPPESAGSFTVFIDPKQINVSMTTPDEGATVRYDVKANMKEAL